jgi:hypothetical protein
MTFINASSGKRNGGGGSNIIPVIPVAGESCFPILTASVFSGSTVSHRMHSSFVMQPPSPFTATVRFRRSGQWALFMGASTSEDTCPKNN